MIWKSLFEIDKKYVPIKPIGKGAYGVVCSAKDSETGAKVAIKKIANAFDNVCLLYTSPSPRDRG